MYRAGIVGLRVGARHAHGYTGSAATQLAAIADLDAALVDDVGRRFDVPSRYTSAEAMLEHEALDIVSVCTPCQLHAPMVIAAAEARPKAIICEKPMAPDMGSVEAMIAACDEHGVSSSSATCAASCRSLPMRAGSSPRAQSDDPSPVR